MIDLQPTRCNICEGEVVLTSNASIYNGKEYGSGKCYLCTNCGAYVGTHENNPKIAFGILTKKSTKQLKIKCHRIFDSRWRSGMQKRGEAYKWLANEMGIPVSECHFGYFNDEQLKQALEILEG